MPVIRVRVEGDYGHNIELADGSKVSMQTYYQMVCRQHGANNIVWDNDNCFTVHVLTPMPLTEEDLNPRNMMTDQDFTKISISDDTLQKMAMDPDWFHVVCMVQRPGTYLFMRKLELEHYRPLTPRNNLFNMVQLKWQELDWTIVSIPITDRPIVEQVAKECGMAFEDGIPHVIGGPQRAARFPMSSPRVFSLRNSANSMVYNGMAAAEMTHEAEMKAVEVIERRHNVWLQEQGF